MDDRETLLRALNYAYFYLKFRPRTRQELLDYLQKKAKRWKWPAGLVDKAIKELEELDLVDDRKFIAWFVEQRSAVKPKGTFILKRKLAQFGVSKEIVDQYFAENVQDEVAQATKAVSFRWQQWKNLDRQERFKKLAGFLTRRGFRYDVVKKTIAKLEGKE
jgi:regulatory protein